MSKREDYISWDEYFMGVALLAAKRSKDPNTQVGACIVNENKKSCRSAITAFRSVAATTPSRGTEPQITTMTQNIRMFATPNLTQYSTRRCTAERMQRLRCSFPLQRVCQGNNPVRNQKGFLPFRQV